MRANPVPSTPSHAIKNLVDLPGFGYAKVSKKQIGHWRQLLREYLSRRESLGCLIVVMDIRHALSDYDWQLIELALESNTALHCLLTKSDKLSHGAAKSTLLEVTDKLEKQGVECTLQLFSALKKVGIDDAHELLDLNLPKVAAHQFDASI